MSYRFLFWPGTLGPLTWLHRNESELGKVKLGLVVAGVGDGGGPTYKRSRRGDALIDQIADATLAHGLPGSEIVDFSPTGYDERQLCSPGFDLPVGLFQRSKFGSFPEYHTSADNLDFIEPRHLSTSLSQIWTMIETAETNYVPLNLLPKGEPQLGRRGLYHSAGGGKAEADKGLAILWVLNQADGTNSLLDIARRAGLPFRNVLAAARSLTAAGLIVEPAAHRIPAPI